jgi:BirA family transcriptional regulator, biotin operon repressor / biotin---[acetyl-CoA-carboxylase] ligase
MPALPKDLALSVNQRALGTHLIGRTFLRYERIGSTNDLARERARSGEDEGLVVLAEEQTAGRGRLDRSWVAPPSSGLLLSVLLRPTWMPPEEALAPTMLAGVALCEAIEQVALVRAALKWPNDLLLPHGAGEPPTLRKAAGVLCDMQIEDGRVAWVVVGTGVNVSWAPQGEVDGQDLAQSATCLNVAAGREIDRGALLVALLQRLDGRYFALRHGRREELFAAWRARLATLGQRVTVRLRDGVLTGVAEDVEPSGALRVREPSGAVQLVTAGDVEL